MKVFFSGGCKNGKSTLAERTAKKLSGDGPLYYIATMIPHDEEDRARIRRHISERDGLGFETVEQGRNLLECLERVDRNGTFLLDAVTSLLANELFRDDGSLDAEAPARVAGELREFVRSTGNAVFVSDYLYADAGHYDTWSEEYRKGLALCDRALAEECDTVVEVMSTCPILYKGELPL